MIPAVGVPTRAVVGKHTLWPVAVSAFALAFVPFVYTPVFLYRGNEAQFFFPTIQVLPMLAVPLVVAAGALFLPSIWMPPRWRQLYAGLIVCVTAFALVHGFLFPRDYGLLDGEVDLPAFAVLPIILSAAVIVAASVAISLAVVRVTVVLSVLLALMLVHMVTIVSADPNPIRPLDRGSAGRLSELGEDNLMVILLDAMQSDVFARVMRDRPDIAAKFQGFTYYPNTLGVGRSTFVSLPAIHSGNVHKAGTSVQEYWNRSIGRESFMTELAESGWVSTLLNPAVGLCPAKLEGCFRNADSLRVPGTDRLVQQSAQMIDVALFRLAPPELKASVYNSDRWRLQRRFGAGSDEIVGDPVLRDFGKSLRVGDAKKTAKFIHLLSTHSPATRRADCSMLDRPLRMSWSTAPGVATCALTRLGELIERLKELDAYDSTSIVLISDTGYTAGKVPSTRVASPEWRGIVGNANPTLAIKPRGASGPFRSRPDELSIADVKSLVCDLTDGCDEMSDWAMPGPDRPRYFMTYDWNDQFWSAPTLKNERRFVVRGPMTDPESWTQLRRVNLPRIDHLSFGPDDRQDHFGFGWRSSERLPAGDDVRWAFGKRALLFLNLPSDAETHLEFDVSLLPEHREQAISFVLNGRDLTKVNIGDDGRVSLDIPSGVAKDQTDELVMWFARWRKVDENMNRHERTYLSLALRFDELRLTYG